MPYIGWHLTFCVVSEFAFCSTYAVHVGNENSTLELCQDFFCYVCGGICLYKLQASDYHSLMVLGKYGRAYYDVYE